MVQVYGYFVIGNVCHGSVECLLAVAQGNDSTYLYVLVIKYSVAQEYTLVQLQDILLAVFTVCLVGGYLELKAFAYSQ